MNDTAIVGPWPDTPAWHAKRLWLDGEGVLGASDAAQLCNMSPYGQPLNVYRRALGLEEAAPTERMRMGKRLEPVIADVYAERSGMELERPLPMLISRERPYLAATPDARRKDGKLVELKSTTWRRAAELGEHGTDWIPDDWFLQVQQQMYVTGADACDVAVLVDRDTFLIYNIPRSDEVIAHVLSAAAEMRERIINRDPPEPDWEHESTPQLIRAMYGVMETVTILDQQVLDWWAESERLSEQIRQADAKRKALRARIEHAMGHAAIGRVPGADIELVRRRVEVPEGVRKAYSCVRLTARRMR